MGRREHEQGEITLPSAAWAGFKRALREAYNNALEADLALLEKAVLATREAHKGKRNVNWHDALTNELWRTNPSGRYIDDEPPLVYPLQVISLWQAAWKLSGKGDPDGKLRLQMPKKKDFPAAKTDTLEYPAGNEAGFSFDNATRAVKWRVSENKDACGRARKTLMGKTLFALLGQVKWTRGTGGAIHGSDEYHEDAGRDTPGGGGSYLKDLFGPLGETVHEDVNGWNRTTGKAVRSKIAIRYVR